MYGLEYERNYQSESKYWWFVATSELYLMLIKKYFPGGNTVIDIGCGTGIMMDKMQPMGKIYGLDYSERALGFCKQRRLGNLACGDARRLPYKTGIADLVTAFGVIEHIKEDKEMMCEIHRVLTSNGYCILLTSAFEFLWSGHDIANHHIRRYTKCELLEIFKRTGFSIEYLSYYNMVLMPVVWLKFKIDSILNKKRPPKRQIDELPRWLNSLFIGFARIETRLSMLFPIPFGINIVAVLRKK